MDRSFFNEQMKKIYTQFNAKSYSAIRINSIYESVQHAEEKAFILAIDILIQEKRSAPLLKDFIEAINRFRGQGNGQKEDCQLCKGSGMLSEQIGLYHYNYRCSCRNGDRHKSWLSNTLNREAIKADLKRLHGSLLDDDLMPRMKSHNPSVKTFDELLNFLNKAN